RYGLSLPWSMRVKIMIGTAQGIAYLHTEENQIIYRDLKTSNILLDQEYNAKIADFGLARHGPINGDTHLSTQVMGTYGYAAPEYIATGYLNGKNDIYSFGVVLLETLTGLRVFDKTRPKNEQNLVEWMRPMLPNKKMVRNIVDPILGLDYPPKAAYKCAQLIIKSSTRQVIVLAKFGDSVVMSSISNNNRKIGAQDEIKENDKDETGGVDKGDEYVNKEGNAHNTPKTRTVSNNTADLEKPNVKYYS
ncbi:probable serine/threonine-protein kinase NAK isoform X2, partial [Tanacetum coccineum]